MANYRHAATRPATSKASVSSMTLEHNYKSVTANIRNAVQEFGRVEGDVTLLGVSKFQPADAVRRLYELGLRDFGENFAQELAAKATELSDLQGIRWHYIGRLQSNKIKLIVRHAAVIQSVSELSHAQLIAKEAKSFRKEPFPIYIAVNAAAETSKGGVLPEDLPGFTARLSAECPGLHLMGIMAIPPASYSDPTGALIVPDLYKNLHEIAEEIGEGQLSLGMSDDLRTAIAAGSNMVRIGTRLFGPRP